MTLQRNVTLLDPFIAIKEEDYKRILKFDFREVLIKKSKKVMEFSIMEGG